MGPDQPHLPGLPGWPRERDVTGHVVSAEQDDEPRVAPPPWANLPDLSDPRGDVVPLAPQIAQPPAVVPAQSPDVVPAGLTRDAPTLTTQIRNLQPPDVARQAASELGVLASELDELPQLLADAGLAGSHGQLYRATLTEYLELCHYAWQAVAQEQLEQAGAAPDYRATAVEVARGIMRLKQECEKANAILTHQSRRLPLLWGRRVALVHRGLETWRAVLTPVPDPLRMGRALFAFQGSVGLASASGLGLALVDLLTSATLALVGMATLGAVLSLIWAMIAGASSLVPIMAATALVGVVTWTLVLLLGVRSALPLGPLLGASIFVPARAACLGWQGSPAVALLLRIWWLVVGSVAALAVPAAVALGGVVLSTQPPISAPANALDATSIVGGVLYDALLLPAVTCVVAIVLLALPFAVTAQVRFVREAAGNVRWVPAARRYALPAALAVVIFLTGLLAVATAAATSALGWQHVDLVPVSWGTLQGTLTLRGVMLIVMAALPYLLLLDLPYRIGIGRWRVHRLADLAARRAELESQVRRLAAQPATDDLLRAMQYNLVLLQFYRGQEEEARAMHAAPYRIEGRTLALAVAVVGGLALDGTGGPVIHLLTTPR